MTPRDPAPCSLRRLATLATVATTVLALCSLPAAELPLAWLLAFTLPGAVLGGWSRLTRSPWRRALLAVTLQALNLGAEEGATHLAGQVVEGDRQRSGLGSQLELELLLALVLVREDVVDAGELPEFRGDVRGGAGGKPSSTRNANGVSGGSSPNDDDVAFYFSSPGEPLPVAKRAFGVG